MNAYLAYWFHLNPGYAQYSSPKSIVLLVLCLALIVGSFAVKRWRAKSRNPMTRKLTGTWPGAMLWFGFLGVFLVVCRVENISFFAMRAWWVIWLVALGVFVYAQYRLYKARHYEVLPQEKKSDPRADYLPKKKR